MDEYYITDEDFNIGENFEPSVEIFTLNKDDVGSLLANLTYLFPEHICEPKRITDIIQTFRINTFTVFAENEYVDRAYRELYYHCYSQMYEEYPRNCVRLTFFEGALGDDFFLREYDEVLGFLNDVLIGTVVLRPLQIGNIGTTYLNPHKLNVSGYFRTCHYEFMAFGYKLDVECFPYSSQDAEMMSCAENAIFNLLNYFGNKYGDYRMIMPSELQERIESESFQRVFPSGGLYEEEIAKVLLSNKLYPTIYHYSESLSDSFERIMYYYVESGIPFLLNLPNHVVTVIGHADNKELFLSVDNGNTYSFVSTGDFYKKFIVMDDNNTPYQACSLRELVISHTSELEDKDISLLDPAVLNNIIENEKKEKVSIIVPLYRRIFLDANKVYTILKTKIFNNQVLFNSIRMEYRDFSWGKKDNPFTYRLFLCTSHNFKSYKNKTTDSSELRYFYNVSFMPKMIWVCEISTIELLSKPSPVARGEIIIDATASTGSYLNGLMFIRYGNHIITSSEVNAYYREKYIFSDDEERKEQATELISTRFDSDEKDYDYMSEMQLTNMIDFLIMKRYLYEEENIIPEEFPIYLGSNLKGEK